MRTHILSRAARGLAAVAMLVLIAGCSYGPPPAPPAAYSYGPGYYAPGYYYGPSYYGPPISLSFGYWGGGGYHHHWR